MAASSSTFRTRSLFLPLNGRANAASASVQALILAMLEL